MSGGDSQIALWNEAHGKFMRMTDNNEIDTSDSKGRDELPDNWSWERFQARALSLGRRTTHRCPACVRRCLEESSHLQNVFPELQG